MNVLIRYSANCLIAITAIPLAFSSCREANQPPSASLTVFPSFGDTSIIYNLDAGKSEDDRDYPAGLMYRWDLDGDGVWDTNFAHNKTYAKRYKQPGTYAVSVEVMDIEGLTTVASDTVKVMDENRDIGTLIDSRDGNEYRMVKILDRWWMAENLRFGIEIPVSQEPGDNGTVERYRISQSGSNDTVGGVYGWYEAMDYRPNDLKGICPDGWHIPTRPEWHGLFLPYPVLVSLQYYGREGLSRLNLDLNNEAERHQGNFITFSFAGGFWGSTYKTQDSERLATIVDFSSAYFRLCDYCWSNTQISDPDIDSRYYSVRCIKDN